MEPYISASFHLNVLAMRSNDTCYVDPVRTFESHETAIFADNSSKAVHHSDTLRCHMKNKINPTSPLNIRVKVNIAGNSF